LRKLFTRRVAPIDKAIRPLDSLNVIAKVTFGGELFLRGEKEKRGYKGPLFEALPGDLIISKIRVGQGSYKQRRQSVPLNRLICVLYGGAKVYRSC
jgi:type I restriction enzyme S subunit